MGQTADSVVVEVEAKLGGFTAQTNQAASQFDQSMDRIESSAGRAETAIGKTALASNQSRIAMLELQHVVRGSADSFASGAPLTQIFAQHVASVGEAAVLAGGSLGRVGALLAGPWGLALTAAVAVGATFVGKLFETNDTLEAAVEKLRKHYEQTNLNAEAEKIWGNSLDGLIQKHKELNDQLDKRLSLETEVNKQALQTSQLQLNAIGSRIAAAEADPNATAQQLEKLQTLFRETALEVYKNTLIVGAQEGASITDLNERAKQWADAQTAIIQRLIGYHPELQNSAGVINAAFDSVKKAVSDAASANVGFDAVTKQIDALNNRLAESPQFLGEYIKDLQKLAAGLEQTVKTAKDAPKAINDFKQSLIGIEGGPGKNPLSSASGFGQFLAQKPGQGSTEWQSYFKQLFPSQAAGMSSAQIDAQRTVRTTAEAIINKATDDYVKVLETAGQSITKANLYAVHLLGAGDARKLFAANASTPTSNYLSAGVLRGNPFLQGTTAQARAAIGQRAGDSSGAVSTAVAAMAQQAAQAAELAQRQAVEFDKQYSELQADLVKALRGRVYTEEEQLGIDEENVIAERDKRIQSVNDEVATKRISAAEGDLLIAKINQVATAKTLALYDAEGIRKAQLLAALDSDRASIRVQTAQFEESQAKTSQQHKAAALELLDAELELERLKQQQILDNTKIGSVEHERAQLALNDLARRRAQGLQAIATDPANLTPGQQFQQSLKPFGDEVQNVAVDALKSMNDEIAKAVTGSETLGQAFHNMSNLIIGELARIAVQELIIKPLAAMLFGGNSDPTGGGGIFSSLLSLFGSGGGGGGGAGTFDALASTFAGGTIPGLASGGSISAGQTRWVGERGPEIFRPSQSGSIVPNSALANGGVVEVRVYAGEGFDTQVLRVTGPVIAQASSQAARGGASMARASLVNNAVHRLGG